MARIPHFSPAHSLFFLSNSAAHLLNVANTAFPHMAHFLGPVNLSFFSLFFFFLMRLTQSCCCLLPSLTGCYHWALFSTTALFLVFSKFFLTAPPPHSTTPWDIFHDHATALPLPWTKRNPEPVSSNRGDKTWLPWQPSQRRSPPSYLPANHLASHSKRVDQVTVSVDWSTVHHRRRLSPPPAASRLTPSIKMTSSTLSSTPSSIEKPPNHHLQPMWVFPYFLWTSVVITNRHRYQSSPQYTSIATEVSNYGWYWAILLTHIFLLHPHLVQHRTAPAIQPLLHQDQQPPRQPLAFTPKPM
jgi:hypothetical protein